MSGCATTDPTQELQKAQKYADQGEYYRARQTATQVLQRNPENAEAKKLIATVITNEVAEHKELFETRTPEEFTEDEQSVEVQALLERSRSLLGIGEYDEALAAAEKIFTYDPESAEASTLIDDIRGAALKDGKAEMLIRNKMARDESKEKVQEYLQTARIALQTGRVGQAQLTLNKILLLDPDNEEALKMRRQLQNKLKTA